MKRDSLHAKMVEWFDKAGEAEFGVMKGIMEAAWRRRGFGRRRPASAAPAPTDANQEVRDGRAE